MTLTNLGDALGLPYQSVQKWEKDRSTPNANQLTSLAKLLNVEVGKLLSGDLLNDNIKSILPEGLNQTINLPLISVNARSSLIADYVDNSTILALPNTFPVNASQMTVPDFNVVIEIEGDTMEPQLNSGAKVLAEAVNPEDFASMYGGLYAVLHGRSFTLRRIINNDILEQGKLILFADNPKYGPIPVDGKNIRAMWKVIRIVDAPIV